MQEINDTPYEPREDSYLIQKHIKDYAKGDVLDMCAGSGILAIEASKYADNVIAVDINQKALKLAKKNTKNIDNIIVKFSDLFSTIHGTFDLIICNPPYLPTDKKNPDLALDGGKHGYEFTIEFIKQADKFLKPDGKILLLFSSLTKKEKIDNIIIDLLYNFKQLNQQKSDFEELYVYCIERTPVLKKLQEINVKDISYLDKGSRGIVYQGNFNKRKVAIKIAKERAELIDVLKKEAKWLRVLEKYRFAPRVIMLTDELLMIELIEGPKILDFLKSSSREANLTIIKDLFAIVCKLDELGINKEEMHHPLKHIIVQANGKDNKPKLIDYERASYTKNPKNLTQFCQFITSGNVSEVLQKKNIIIQKQQIIDLAKQYKKENRNLVYKQIIGLFS
ncbi:methyltransferase [Candidatus Woesearchaeota archaeon]|nr:methyltransferase [Candidatus Woesearchaeota archaeon]